MVKEKIKPSDTIACPYYAYKDKASVTVAANSYVNLTLGFSTPIDWSTCVITSEFQSDGCITDINPVNASQAKVSVTNHTGSSKTGIVRVRALLSVNATMTLT